MKFLALFKPHKWLNDLSEAQEIISQIQRFGSVEKVYASSGVVFAVINANKSDEAVMIAHYAGLTALRVWAIEFETDSEGNLMVV